MPERKRTRCHAITTQCEGLVGNPQSIAPFPCLSLRANMHSAQSGGFGRGLFATFRLAEAAHRLASLRPTTGVS